MLIGIMFIVATLSYAYSIYRQSKNEKELLAFVENFSHKESYLDTDNLKYDDTIKKPLFLLAKAYTKSGDYAKSINLYLYLLEHSKDESILTPLADAYLLAGFYKKALSLYLKIIYKKPRDKEALYKLELIYEKLADINSAKDALNVLENLGESVEMLRLNLDILEINRSAISNEQKFNKLKSLLDSKTNKWPIVRELFKLDAKRAFSYYKDSYFEKIVDILYMQSKEAIDFDVVEGSNNLSALYYIKGYLQTQKESNIFLINLLSKAKECGLEGARVEFVYICQKCKNRYPLFFNRCPNCHRAYKTKIEVSIAKEVKRDKTLQ
jgi:lipopolysaccharide biosynthesis regulator YciM